MKTQKQMGTKDCGLFAIVNAVALVLWQNPSKLRFHQESSLCCLCRTREAVAISIVVCIYHPAIYIHDLL